MQAFAEWVIFMSSGISSALYHACDAGSWCALSYSALQVHDLFKTSSLVLLFLRFWFQVLTLLLLLWFQFMDFWLSFLAVVSTFVYLTTFSETAKWTIHTAAAIITALLAERGATRY